MNELDGKLRLHEAFASKVVDVGAEHEPVLVVDNFLADAQILVDFTATHSKFENASDSFYPGAQAPIPPIYSFAVRAFLGQAISDAFGLSSASIAGEKCTFSIVTTPPDRLSPLQRLPHFDNTDPRQLAVLHYLCRPDQGGTSFYRHRATNFETMSEARLPIYKDTLEKELEVLGPPPPRYFDGDGATFVRTASFDAVFNRVLIYRSATIHSANIPTDAGLNADPRIGRLTANVFYYFR